jgi:O-antigen/teichoic acid export membrane protein
MAYTISALVVEQVSGVVHSIAFAALSKVQNDLPKLREGYLRTLRLVALGAFPFAAGLWFVAEAAVETFLGERWLPMVPAMAPLLVWGLFRSIGSTTVPLFRSMGTPKINTFVQLASLLVLASVIYPFTVRFGITGAAWTTVAAALPFAASLRIAAHRLQTRPFEIARLVFIPAACTSVMIAVLLLVDTLLPGQGAQTLLWAPPVGVLSYVGSILIARRYLGYARNGFLKQTRFEGGGQP